MKRPRWWVAVLLAAPLALTSCASAAPPVGSPSVLTPDGPSEVRREAAVDGEVGLRDGCFLLVSAEAEWLIEWPYGTTLGEDLASVDTGESGTVRVGDTISGGGGYGDQTPGCALNGVAGTVSIDTITEVVPGRDG